MSASSPNSSAVLLNRTIAWSLETGLPASVHVRFAGKIYDLHKLPLVSKSGYFRRVLASALETVLPDKFPGGVEAFEMAVLCCYGSPLPFDPFNIVAARCAAHVLEMDHDRADLYLNQVVLQSWDDTLIVLQTCQTLLPWAEELLIISRCVESLAFMACMEILDPESSRNWPVVAAGQELWIKDLLALPFQFFKRIIVSLRRQGMKEKYVSPIVVFYAKKWVVSKKTRSFCDDMDKISSILEGVLELLPLGDNTVIPAELYFSLLSRSMTLPISDESRIRLQDKVASLLHLANIEDFLLPGNGACSITSTPEFQAMERIVSINVSSNRSEASPLATNSSTVAELWDRYLSRIATDPILDAGKFMELVEIVPMDDRESHDFLYTAFSFFLQEHPNLTNEEKTSVCKYLNCQKLSQEICIEAVQNELMPLRLIVQALFVQQLHTHQAFKECSSFRCVDFSGSQSQNLENSPFNPESEELTVGPPLGSLLKKEAALQKTEINKADFESASFRLQALERELISLKQSLRWQNVPDIADSVVHKTDSFRLRAAVKKRNAGSCIGSLSWATHRKYVGRLMYKHCDAIELTTPS